MIDKDLVMSKMSDLQESFEELRVILLEDARSIIDDHLKLHTAERLFQLIVDTAVDINTHIIIESQFHVPNDYQSTFLMLGEQKALPMDFAVKIAPSVGLRNLVVHRYGRVDVKRMIDDIKNEIGQYQEYLGYVRDFLEKNKIVR